MLSDACVEAFYIRPVDDDGEILQAALRFQDFVRSFKRLDLKVEWQREFIAVKIKYVIKGLEETMRERYGSYEEYSYRSARRCQGSRAHSKA